MVKKRDSIEKNGCKLSSTIVVKYFETNILAATS